MIGGTNWTRDETVRHNVLVESLFSAFNGIFMAHAILAAPVVAASGLHAGPRELTVIVSAFPAGVFFGPLWAGLGRRWGMRRLVTQMSVWANLPLFAVFWIDDSWLFTILISIAQILNSAMRMGQSSLYPVLYPRDIRGRVIGRLTFWTYATMVPASVATGWLLDVSHDSYRFLYPLAGVCGLVGSWFYGMLNLPKTEETLVVARSWRSTIHNIYQALGVDRSYRVFQIGYFLSGASFFMSTHVILLLSRDSLHFGPMRLALLLTVMPQFVLALSSPLWGVIYDRIGIVWCRVLISILATVYLLFYLLGVLVEWPVLIAIGSALFGFGNSGGQLTWALGSSHFAPRTDDVPAYNGVHFVLNGIRGLFVPWIGSTLLVFIGPWALLVAALTSGVSILASFHLVVIERGKSKPACDRTESPPPALADVD